MAIFFPQIEADRKLWQTISGISEGVKESTSIPELEAYKLQLEQVLGAAKRPETPASRVQSVVAPGVIDAKQRSQQLAAADEIAKFADRGTEYAPPLPTELERIFGTQEKPKLDETPHPFDVLEGIDLKLEQFRKAQEGFNEMRTTAPKQNVQTGVFPGSVTAPLQQSQSLVSGGSAIGDDRNAFISDMTKMVSESKRRSSYVPVFGYY